MSTEPPQRSLSDFTSSAEEEKRFNVEINYDILNQVSKQLYTNPRRAIEELVCNSYDAAATECYVSTPSDGDDFLQVLDNGISMDEDRMEDLWDVAGGPKKEKAEKGEERQIEGRKQIGRFGVGKLAAFALGGELTHIATKNGTTRVINIQKSDIEGKDVTDPPKATIYKKSIDDAKEDLEEYFEGLENPWDKDDSTWDSWTLAVVDDVPEQNTGRDLHAEFLDRMIRTAIPRNANFEAYRNGQPVGTRDYPDDKLAQIDIVRNEQFHNKLSGKLREFWTEWDGEIDEEQLKELEGPDGDLSDKLRDISSIEEEKDVPEELCNITARKVEPNDASADDVKKVPSLVVPVLGTIRGEGIIYNKSLKGGKAEEDRNLSDYGYRVRVRGKLLNRGSPRFDTPAKPHRYWNRFLGEIEAPSLDDRILVQRDDIREGLKAELVRTVLEKLFYHARNQAEFNEEEEYEPDEFGHHLRGVSPDLAPRALQGLFDDPSNVPERGWDDIEVMFEDFGHSGEIAKFEESEEVIYVNESHAFFQALKSEDVPDLIQKAFREAVIGPLAMSGLLKTHHVSDEVIEEGRRLSEQTLKAAARYVEDPYEMLCDKVETKSYEGDDPFERAIVEALDYIGLPVEHEGGSGDSDAIIEIVRPGEDNLRLSVEAKGKEDEDETVSHSDLNLSTASGHSFKDDCDHVLAVAREFQTTPQSGEDEAQLVTELNLEKHNDISVLTVEAIQKLLRNHRETPYNYEQLRKILTHQKDPDSVTEVVDEHWQELGIEDNVVESILEAAWEEQSDEGRVDPSIRMVYRHEKVRDLDIEDNTVESVLLSAQAQTGLVQVDDEDYEIHQSPNVIADKLL
jgi:hypothetical protein